MLNWFKPTDARWQELNAKLQEYESAAPKPQVKMLIASEGVPAIRLHTQGPDFYEKTFQVKRGDPNQKVAEAAPRVSHRSHAASRRRRALENRPA